MVYGELGRHTKIEFTMIGYWCKLKLGKKEKLVYKMYMSMLDLYEREIYISPWISIENVLNDCGLADIWLNQNNLDINLQWLKEHNKRVSTDKYMQVWRECILCERAMMGDEHHMFECTNEDIVISGKEILYPNITEYTLVCGKL